MKFFIYNTKTNQAESYIFDTNNQNDMDDFKGWDEEIKDHPEYTIKEIKEFNN